MPNNRGDEFFPEAATASWLDYKNIRQPGERRAICYDTGKTDLLLFLKHAKTERVPNGTLDNVDRHVFGPVTAFAQKGVNQWDIQPGLVVGYDDVAFSYFVWFHKTKNPAGWTSGALKNFQVN
jgi:hypothetical protein